MKILTGIYPNLTDDPDRFKPIQDLVSDLTPDQYMKGIRLFCLYHTEVYASKGGAFTNLVALIRKYAFDDPREKTPIEVWGDVVAACKKNEKDPAIADPIAKRIAAGLGFTTIKWEAIDGSDLNGFNRSHFLRAYEQASARRKMNLIAGFETEEKKLCESS